MLFFFSSILLSIKNDLSFKGTCTTQGNVQPHSKLFTNSTQFFLTVTQVNSSEYSNSYRCILEFYQNNQIDIETRFELFGAPIHFANENSYIFFRDLIHTKLKSSLDYLSLTLSNFTNISTLEDLYNHILQNNFSPYVLSLRVKNKTITDYHPYFLDKSITGNFNVGNTSSVALIGQQVNMITFVSEGKTFGFLLSICILLDFYAWFWVTKTFNTRSLLQQFSQHSLILHVGYSFGLLFFTLDIAVSIDHFTKLFIVVFLFMIICFFYCQIPLLADVWRANQEIFTQDNIDIHEIQYRMLMLFLELSIEIILSSVLTTYMFEYSLICSFLQILAFLPQIYHLIKNPLIMKPDYFFLTTIYLIRLVPIYYFSMKPTNFLFVDCSKPFGIFLMIFWSIQYIVLLLQNTFGGDFFLPKASRVAGYNYRLARNSQYEDCSICMTHIEEADETMTPPCGHTFHRNCLLRWMEEDRICPVCRAPLPIEARD